MPVWISFIILRCYIGIICFKLFVKSACKLARPAKCTLTIIRSILTVKNSEDPCNSPKEEGNRSTRAFIATVLKDP